MSRYSRVFPDAFDMTTIGLRQVVGQSTFSVMSNFNKLESSVDIFSLL